MHISTLGRCFRCAIVGVCSDIEAGAAYQDRLEGMIMRSQLLVLLQNQVFTDSQGRLLSGEVPSQRLEMQLDCQMRSFYRTRYMHRQAAVPVSCLYCACLE